MEKVTAFSLRILQMPPQVSAMTTSMPRAPSVYSISSLHLSPNPMPLTLVSLSVPLTLSHTLRQGKHIFINHLQFSSLFIFTYKESSMILKAASGLAVLNANGEALRSPFLSSVSTPFSSHGCALKSFVRKNGNGFAVCATKGSNNRQLTGVIFEPFEEVKKELMLVPAAPQESLARQKFLDDSEAAINEQINVEYNVSYVYHAMYAYFDRDNVALKGLAKFFKESSDEEREHAEKLMEYQNKRGGKVKLQAIVMPLSEFDHVEKGDALYAMELALALEKLTNEKLLNLHAVAARNNDPQMVDFVQSEFLAEQVEAIKKISEYVAQLRRVGKGHGVWHFNQMLLHELEEVAA